MTTESTGVPELIGRVALARFAEAGISEQTREEFVERVAATVRRLQSLHPGLTVGDRLIDLFGHGHVSEVLTNGDTSFVFGHEAQDVLGWDPGEFDRWARHEYLCDLEAQRERDLESGELGWDCIGHWPIGVSVWCGEGRSDDHCDEHGAMTGPILRNWCDIYLISTDGLLNLMMSSPWGKEFIESARPLLAHGFTSSGLTDLLGEVPTYDSTGNPTGRTLADEMAKGTEGLTVEEAVRRALRGPSVPGGDDE